MITRQMTVKQKAKQVAKLLRGGKTRLFLSKGVIQTLTDRIEGCCTTKT